jgi:hypothetical protein
MQDIQSINAAKLQDTYPQDPLSDYIELHKDDVRALKLCAFSPMPHCEKPQPLCSAGSKPTFWTKTLTPRHWTQTQRASIDHWSEARVYKRAYS